MKEAVFPFCVWSDCYSCQHLLMSLCQQAVCPGGHLLAWPPAALCLGVTHRRFPSRAAPCLPPAHGVLRGSGSMVVISLLSGWQSWHLGDSHLKVCGSTEDLCVLCKPRPSALMEEQALQPHAGAAVINTAGTARKSDTPCQSSCISVCCLSSCESVNADTKSPVRHPVNMFKKNPSRVNFNSEGNC